MNRAVPDEIVDQIRLRSDIVEVVQSYIPLKHAGQSFKACCPFHQEKTPSFTVNPVRQSFHCFGCGKGGDVFRFVMERENVDFPNALHILANRYGIRIPEADERHRQTPLKPEERPDFKERLYILHDKMKEWFAKNLQNTELPVSKYLATRGLPEESILKFGLGATIDSWNAGTEWARREGFTDQELTVGGLLVESADHPGRFYDRFRNRLMFPIWNEQGRVVGFSARTVEAEAHGGKYVNSPETPIFKKSRILYGLHMARTQIAKDGFALLCEGQLDVIAMHRADFSNAVAPQGTAFTEEQAAILKRYTDTILLALDSDAAGQKAILRCAEIALPAGFLVKVVQFPSGKDPDELLKTAGKQAIADSVNAARDFFEFLFNKLASEFDMDSPSGKAEVAGELVKFINLLEGEIQRATYTQWLSGKLGIDQTSLVVKAPVRRNRIREAAVEAAKVNQVEKERAANPQIVKALSALLECIIQDKDAAARAMGELGDIVFSEEDGPLGKAVETVIQATMNGEWEDATRQVVAGIEPGKDCPQLTALLTAEAKQMEPRFLAKTVDDCLRHIRIDHAKRRAAELLKDYMATEAGPERDALAAEHSTVSRMVTQLNSRKGNFTPPPLPPRTKPTTTPKPVQTPVKLPVQPPPPKEEIPDEIIFEEEDFSNEEPFN